MFSLGKMIVNSYNYCLPYINTFKGNSAKYYEICKFKTVRGKNPLHFRVQGVSLKFQPNERFFHVVDSSVSSDIFIFIFYFGGFY